jgi:hypothetical protein
VLAAPDEWETFWVLKRLDGQIYVQIRPVEMILLWPMDIQDLRHRCVGEPGEFLESYEQLSVSEKDPETLRRDIRNLSGIGVGARLL